MINYSDFQNINELKIQQEMNNLNQFINMQNTRKSLLLNCLDNINFSIQNMDNTEDLDNCIQLLKDIKKYLDNIREITYKLVQLQNLLKDLSNCNDILFSVDKYNNLYAECVSSIYKYTVQMDNFIFQYVQNSIFVPSENVMYSRQNKIELLNQVVDGTIKTNISSNISSNINNTINNDIENNNVEDNNNIKDTNNIENNNIENNYVENNRIENNRIENNNEEYNKKTDDSSVQLNNSLPITDNSVLLISEKQNKVFLPYSLSDLQHKLSRNKKYKSIQDVINNEYIIPLDKYKNPIISRFRESYALMKNKEHSSVLDSLDLAVELCFNSLLNPAIISACKNLDELDIYLDYLDSNELDKFKLFEIKYELLPKKI